MSTEITLLTVQYSKGPTSLRKRGRGRKKEIVKSSFAQDC